MHARAKIFALATGHVVKPMVHIRKGSHRIFLEDDEVQMRIAVRIHSTLDLKGGGIINRAKKVFHHMWAVNVVIPYPHFSWDCTAVAKGSCMIPGKGCFKIIADRCYIQPHTSLHSENSYQLAQLTDC